MILPTYCRLPLLILGLIFTIVSTAAGQTNSETEYPEDIVARVQAKYDSMNSLSFSFNQRSQGEMSGRPRIGSGEAFFYKNEKQSKMRWNYREPDRQVLISDGETFSMYFEELEQMIITPADRLDDDLTYTFFSGQGRIADSFHILPPDPEYLPDQNDDGSLSAVKLAPREPQSQVQSIHVWVSDDSLIRRIEIRDHFDTTTLLNLKDIKINFLASMSDESIGALFSFSPPEGTEIIRQ